MDRIAQGTIAECIGAFALMFVGGAAILNGGDLLQVALAHGLILSVTVSALMHISGGQFNPAVSIALASIGKQSWGLAAAYSVAQLAGAVLAAFLLTQFFTPAEVEAVRLGATLGRASIQSPDSLVTPSVAVVMIVEAIATFLLMITILGSAVDPRGVGKDAKVGGFAIGLCVAALILAIGPITGASMNPCRSFGPALVGGYWAMHAAYWVGPITGAIAAAFAWRSFLSGARAS